MNQIVVQPLTAQGFAPFGDVLQATGTADKIINQGLCERFNDRAQLNFGRSGRAGISMFHAQLRALPYSLEMVERHPEGSQAFLPLSPDPFLVIVAPDEAGKPGTPLAFLTAPGQGINLHLGTWHGVLTPLSGSGIFAVVDRIAETPNLEEFWFDTPYMVVS